MELCACPCLGNPGCGNCVQSAPYADGNRDRGCVPTLLRSQTENATGCWEWGRNADRFLRIRTIVRVVCINLITFRLNELRTVCFGVSPVAAQQEGPAGLSVSVTGVFALIGETRPTCAVESEHEALATVGP